MTNLELSLGGEPSSVELRTGIVAGWAGRDAEAVERHVVELEKAGMKRPSATPLFYRVSAARITSAAEIESTPTATGEVEAVLLRAGGRLWVGTGSDHTDHEVETYSPAVAKELCMKPIAPELWAFEEVEDHWDELVIRSWIAEGGEEVLYQEGTLESLVAAADLIAGCPALADDGALMFCGTVPVRGGIRPAERFRYELEDPVRGRAIGAGYSMRELPLVS
jgi:hypothetical protein